VLPLPAEAIRDEADSESSDGPGGRLVRLLRYEVREGREAGEVVVIPQVFIANCKVPFILQYKEV